MSIGLADAMITIMAALFSLAFAAWARRLDKALDLLEKIQQSQHRNELSNERRLARLEQIARTCTAHRGADFMMDDENDDDNG